MRFAFVFRWLSKRHAFHAHGEGALKHALVLTPDMLEQESAKKAAKAKKKRACPFG